MNDYYGQDWTRDDAPQIESGSLANAFLGRIFTIMTLGLAITGLTSWLFANWLVQSNNFDVVFGGGIGTLLMFAPLIFVLVLSFGIHKMSYMTATLVFIAYCTVMGLSLSAIFLLYATATIFKVFFITAGTFGLMALAGYTTKLDLTKLGGLFMMLLVGLILAMVVNYFMQSESMDYMISCAGVVIFMGLTAWDVQRFKRMAYAVNQGEEANKMAVMGALSLYLNFINLFLFLLRLFGRE